MAITKHGTRQFFWESGDLEYKLHSMQRIIDQAVKRTKADEVLVLSCRRFGKSYWAVNFAIEYCIQNPGSVVRVIAPTLKQVQDIVEDSLSPISQDAPHGLITRHKSQYRWTIGSSSLRLGAMERAHVDNNRGTGAHLVVLEEGGFVNSADYDYAIKSVFGPQVLRTKGRIIHVSTPSEDIAHILHTEIMPKTKLTNSFFQYTIYDNPQLTQEHIDKAIALCGGTHTTSWRREYLAEIFRDDQSVVVPEFNGERHVREFEIPEHARWQVSIDFGGVRDKTVALLYAYDFLRNLYLWLDERVFDANTSTSAIVKSIREMEASQTIEARWADAPGQLQIDLEQSHGYSITVPLKDDWKAAINNLQVAFGQDLHEIHPRCKMLIQTLESGRFNKQRTDFERNPILGHCDAIAAMSYGYRMAARDNPYPVIAPPRDTTFNFPKPKTDEQKMAELMHPKFGSDFNRTAGYKKFGTFRK